MIIVAGVGENKDIVKASKMVDFSVVLTESEDEFVDLLFKGEADAFLRGSLNASTIMASLKEKYGDIYRASYLEVDEHGFFLAPVGIDEGDLLSQKIEIIEYGAQFLIKLGLKPNIAILSGGRAQDVGRSQKIDDSLAQGKKLTDILMNKYPVKHYFILIEDAVADQANLILAPDGISGNLIFRSLAFIGSVKSHGAVTLGIPQILVDTSRSQNKEGYLRALNFAKYLIELRNHHQI